jgi:hypothetical protein
MKVRVTGAGFTAVNGLYSRRPFSQIPVGFAKTCTRMGWPADSTWQNLATHSVDWFANEENDSYIYLHRDKQWWIDGPDGSGIYIARNKSSDDAASGASTSLPHNIPPQTGWNPLASGLDPLPVVEVLQDY